MLKKLTQKKYRKEFGVFTVEGKKGVEEALEHAEVELLIVEESAIDADMGVIISYAEKTGIPVERANKRDVDAIKQTETFPGVMAVVAMPDASLDNMIHEEHIILLDRVNDPGNLGTIIRTADWFGVHAVIVSEGSVDPYNEKVVRSTMGSIFRTKIYQSEYMVDTVEFLRKNGYSIATLDLSGKDISQLRKGRKQALLFGSESHGLADNLREITDASYTIAGTGNAESLNLAMSVGITLYQLNS
ncbi:MAG: RNA methyltransferase, TrmH family, group 3 [Candidatus Magasanikbacteria bacterium GW2011_GWD2_43_18]|uniref:RNA methyltransferase, TrmH family, group 3 n=1 Tax=Candidatus Magasanikbacteria bacterium GW2011_GWE2_42_7 TaxID=1619052 RepID=A0A0G1BI10_9BACT|nr:MAG: RNA methyltransferase, TrmH family, group 3 [Candidatus Magasanikbacteria bacterium GW2011_GWC2_42_27]KKS73040.1 MAG: RNA methyltransferase, TrmH family, group 3 [Candidatus Magasanikbacteria bacterium GW2011_GWE2_42_7]KKT03974.1 MAG: RNA methyltransferase, TrmH family, group 3 [Candidatus Magasanikbacteria bacterium GW2011_GWD2_43_18]KKT25543.1 MAG: RNA methyltransferase, TrmH family, group 3 [Candidatus Magasanikbacteria bacterium GW2011_GWA2_43_9]